MKIMYDGIDFRQYFFRINMKKAIIIFILYLFLTLLYSQENEFFLNLSKKETATFNDGIALMKILFHEKYSNSSFYENILWAAEKKLFKVTIPITTDEINPNLTRREFAYWICKIFNGKDGIINYKNINRYSAYKICVMLGVFAESRGSFDTFSGLELIDTFSYLDYYIKSNNILPNKEIQPVIEDDNYTYLPEWRQRIYRELEEQRAMEKEKREKRFNAIKVKIKTENKTEKINEKKVE
jgi:hypothetical protein